MTRPYQHGDDTRRDLEEIGRLTITTDDGTEITHPIRREDISLHNAAADAAADTLRDALRLALTLQRTHHAEQAARLAPEENTR